MGQIRGTKAKISACNIRSLSSFGIPYSGMHILVSTDNSAMADGNGNFDAYVVGDGQTAATALELKYIEKEVGKLGVFRPRFSDGYYYTYNSITPTSGAGIYTPTKIDISKYVGYVLHIHVNTYNASSARSTLLLDEADNIIYSVEESEFTQSSDGAFVDVLIPRDAKYILVSFRNNVTSWDMTFLPDIEGLQQEILQLDQQIGEDVSIDISTKLATGHFYTSSSTTPSDGNGKYIPIENKIDVANYVGGEVEILFSEIKTTSARACLVADASNNVLTAIAEKDFSYDEQSGKYVGILQIPTNSSYLLISFFDDTRTYSVTIKRDGLYGRVNQLEEDVEHLNSKIIEPKVLNIAPLLVDGHFYLATSVAVQDGSGKYVPPSSRIDVSKYVGGTLHIEYGAINSVSGRACLITDENENVLNTIIERDFNLEGSVYKAVLPIAESAKYLYISFSNLVTSYNFTLVPNEIKDDVVKYVDADNGSDANAGTESSPYKTIRKAIETSGIDTCVIFTGRTNESVNIKQKPAQKSLTIIGKAGKRNVIEYNAQRITSASVYSGDIYSTQFTLSLATNHPLYQYQVNDASTLIQEADRLPQQRGKEYRCEHTLLQKFSTLAEMEASSNYGYFYSNGTLYLRTPSTDYANHPVIVPYTNGYGIHGNDGSVQVHLVNVEFEFCGADLSNSPSALIEDCKSGYGVSAGCFVYNFSNAITFKRCEAVRADNGGVNGDGFNGHANIQASDYSEYVKNAKFYTCTLIDCWAHDIKDDGYSDHERAETSIYGGLFEYCGKGCVMPSYGSHCSCYNVITRNCVLNGFYVAGDSADITPDEGGKHSQLLCIGCLSYGHGSAGFRAANYNKLIAIECVSRSNSIGYAASSNGTMTLENCYQSNNNTPTEGGNLIEIINSQLVQ